MSFSNALEVSSIPPKPSSLTCIPVIIITNAVIVQIITVSINGSNKETKPSVTG